MKTIYLVRHGESKHNLDRTVLSGVSDVEMTDAGREQCRRLTEFFRSQAIQAVYASPLKRAMESAAIVFPSHEIQIDPCLIEINYGEYEGRSGQLTGADDVIRMWNQAPGEVVFPGGDAVKVHASRAHKGLSSLASNAAKDVIACVTHRTTGRLLIAQILGIDLNAFRRLPMDNCSLTELGWDRNAGLSLVSLNVTLNYTAN